MTPFQRHTRRWRTCDRCPLCTQRRRVCLARGTVPCEVLFIGEAPGASEDVIGKPFCGPAGYLLDYIIAGAGLRRGQYAITNLVACFAREAKAAGVNEPPLEAIRACAPRLVEMVQMCEPGLVVLVGKLARKHVPWECVEKMDWVEITHPAAILRMDVSQQGLAIQRATVTIEDAVEGL